MMRTMMIGAAGRVAGIRNDEVRDLLAYALDEVHAWRCGLMGDTKECDAVAAAFTDLGRDGELTRVGKMLQPLSELSGWYLVHPITRRVAMLQEWDDEFPDDADHVPTFRWRWNWAAVAEPWKVWPGFRNEWKMIARFAARRTWYSADQFIAEYVAEAAPRIAAAANTVPLLFHDKVEEFDDDTVVACYRYSLEILARMAREELDMTGDTELWSAALAEAINLGMLWD